MIQLKSFTKDATSRTKGLQLKTKLEHAIKEERNISVDFDGIDKFASPFFNNSFSALGIQYGFGTIEKIELLNISDNGKLVFDSSMENAKFLTNHKDQKKEIEDITKYATRLDWGEIPGLFLLKKVATKLLIFVAT